MATPEEKNLSLEALSLTSPGSRILDNIPLYPPINDEADEIRLLTIHPHDSDVPERPLRCELSVHSLDNQPSFTALSYVWGDHTDTHAIVVNGHEVQVTSNLADALYQLRKDRYSTVWVDALCINQADDGEKSRQVPKMEKIYQTASEVVAWLGQEDETTLDVFSKMNELAKLADNVQLESYGHISCAMQHENAHVTNSIVESLGLSSSYREGDIGLILTFLKKSYWQRVWIIQELCLAKHATLHCGAHSIDWHSTLKALRVLEWLRIFAMNIHTYTGIEGVQERLEFLYRPFVPDNYGAPPAVWISSHGHRHGWGLFSLMNTTLHETQLECANPQDRIYALLGLMWRGHRQFFPVDYTKSYIKLFIQATKVVMLADGSDALLYAGLAYRNEEDEDLLPSWVVDWRCTRLRAERLYRYLRTDQTFARPWRFAGNAAVAFVAAAGAEIRETVPSSKSLRDIVGTLQRAQESQSLRKETVKNLPDYTLKGSIWRTLLYRTGQYFGDFMMDELFEKSLNNLTPEVTLPESKNELTFESLIDNDSPRSIFITATGSVGSAPPCAQVGDVVHAIKGLDLPILLRPAGEDDCWRLVGPAFVSDMLSRDDDSKLTLNDFWSTEPECKEVTIV